MSSASFCALFSRFSPRFCLQISPNSPRNFASVCSSSLVDRSWADLVAFSSLCTPPPGCSVQRSASKCKVRRTFCSYKPTSTDILKMELVTFESLWEQAAPEISNIIHHPFMLSTLTGTLPLSGLANYLQDEAYILTSVSQVLNDEPVSSSLAKLSDFVLNLKKFASNGTLETEETSGDLFNEVTQASVSTKEFKAFLIEQTLSGDSLKGVLCSLVVLQLRKLLESAMSSHLPPVSKGPSAFQLWISAYTHSELQNSSNLLLEELNTKLCQRKVTVDQLDQLQLVVNTTLGHHLRVLDSASAGNMLMMVQRSDDSSPWFPHRLLFTTDYDVTCTVKDTCEILVALAEASLRRKSLKDNRETGSVESLKMDSMTQYWSLLDVHDQRYKECLAHLENVGLFENATQQKMGIAPLIATGNTEEDSDRDAFYVLPGMDRLLEPLVESAKEHLKIVRRMEEVPARISEKLTYNDSGLRETLKLLGELEIKVNLEIMASGVLSGITKDDIRGAAKKIPLRNGCAQVLLRLATGSTPIHLISANWSRDLIAGGLPTLPEGRLYVHSNDLNYNSEGVSDGRFLGVVQHAFDKENIFQALRRLYVNSSCDSDFADKTCYALETPDSQAYTEEEVINDNIENQSDVWSPQKHDILGSKMSVFLGDSPNDLLALLAADLGIVFGQNKSFRLLLRTYNIKLLPLVVASAQISLSFSEKKPVSFRHSGLLFEAASWADVEACLFGHCEVPENRWTATSGNPKQKIFHSHI